MNLVYTTVFDPPGRHDQLLAARMLVSSLLRTGFGGEIVVFTNSEIPLFHLERKGIEEIPVELDPLRDCLEWQASLAWRVLGPRQLDLKRFRRALYMAPDSLVMRNIDHLCEGEWDLVVQRIDGGAIDGGFFGFRPRAYARLADEFDRRFQDALRSVHDQTGAFGTPGGENPDEEEFRERIDPLPDLLIERRFPAVADFEAGEVCHPLHGSICLRSMGETAVVRAGAGDWAGRLSFLFGQYASRFLWDPRGVVLSLLEP